MGVGAYTKDEWKVWNKNAKKVLRMALKNDWPESSEQPSKKDASERHIYLRYIEPFSHLFERISDAYHYKTGKYHSTHLTMTQSILIHFGAEMEFWVRNEKYFGND